MSDETQCEECEEGAPEWMATFADLMSLLMCFFVLLLSFSEMDLQKFKQVAGSMDRAFGVQRVVKSDTIPRGTSVIKQEFSPGTPQPTVIKTVTQRTEDDARPEIQINAPIPQELSDLQELLEATLETEIESDVLEVLVSEDGVMIRVRDADAFPSGSAQLQAGFIPVLDKLQELLSTTSGRIVVAGHTDNLPINTVAYPSNWILSAARSASVVDYLTKSNIADSDRIEIRAYADTQPVAPNDSVENRAKNRRIEINLRIPE